jgi:hypothetical protein
MMPVEDIRPGDVVCLPSGAEFPVRRVASYEDGTLVVVYVRGSEAVYGRGGSFGWTAAAKFTTEDRSVERGLRPMLPGEFVNARRDPDRRDPPPEVRAA